MFCLTFPETISTLSLKNLWKSEKCHIWTLKAIIFSLKVDLKPFSKTLTMNNSGFKQFSTLCLVSPENSSNFVTQKFAKKWNISCLNPQNIYFSAQGNYFSALKQFFKMFPMTNFGFRQFWKLCLAFPKNIFNFVTQKFVEKWKMPFPSAQNIRFLSQASFKTIF